MVLGKSVIHMKKSNQIQVDQRLKCIKKNLTILRINIEAYLYQSSGKEVLFCFFIEKEPNIKEEINKFDQISIKKPCSLKDTMKHVGKHVHLPRIIFQNI